MLVETLVAFGVRHVFGMVGPSNLGFADALRRAKQRGEISYVGIRTKGRPRSPPRPTANSPAVRPSARRSPAPGSTNLLTGLYDARLDQSPVLAISGQVASKVLGRGAFQDLNLSSVFKDVATSSVTLQAGSDHAELAALAVKRALDRRGVAHLILPDEVQILLSDQPAAAPEGRLPGPAGTPPAAELAVAAGWVSRAARPVIVAGHGARGARDRVLALAERLGAPVLTTFKAKGLIPDSHPLGAGYWAAAVLRWPAG